MKRCESGKHHFDVDKFTSCPHCVRTRITPRRDIPVVSIPKQAIRPPAETDPTIIKPKAEPFPGPQSSSKSGLPVTPTEATPDSARAEQVEQVGKPAQILKESVPQVAGAPTVGWLVIVGGRDSTWESTWLGTDFRLLSGSNRIGVGTGNEVNLDIGDPRIDRDCHSVLTYDPESKQYFIQKGLGRGLTHVRYDKRFVKAGTEFIEQTVDISEEWQVILSPTLLKPKTIVRVGNTELLFLPLCNDEFYWPE